MVKPNTHNIILSRMCEISLQISKNFKPLNKDWYIQVNLELDVQTTK